MFSLCIVIYYMYLVMCSYISDNKLLYMFNVIGMYTAICSLY